MSADSSRNSIASSYSEREDEVRHSSSYKITKRLKTLFCCVKHESHERVVEYDPDVYDYVIEKLVVKRMPLALFAIRADIPNRHGSDVTTAVERASRSASSSIFDKGNNPVVSAVTRETTLMKTTTDSGALSHRARSSAWQKEILDRFSTLHPELKESEKPPKDPLNFPQSSKRLFAKNVCEASNMKTDVFSKEMSSAMVQDESVVRDKPVSEFDSGGMEKRREASSKKDQGNCFPGLNRKYIVLPFRVRRGSFDLETPKNVDEDIGRVDCKSLTYLEESVEDRTLQSAATSKKCDLVNTAVRWRITIRRRRANADSAADSVASEVEFLRKEKMKI